METFELIESFFGEKLSESERKEFELRCENDPEFAGDVASYIIARQEMKASLLKQKQDEWTDKSTVKKEDNFIIKPLRRIRDYKWRYAAAAIIILIVGTYFFETQSSAQKLATAYSKENFMQLSLTMDGSKDSMQMALDGYNNKHYDSSITIFNQLYKANNNNEALKDAGIAYLMKKDYENAIMKFDALAEKQNLFSNPGLFYKAITLMQRNKNNDKADAKLILHQVVQQNLDGSKDAADWLKKF